MTFEELYTLASDSWDTIEIRISLTIYHISGIPGSY